MILIAWLPIWAAIKSFGGSAVATLMRSRALQIVLVIAAAFMLYRCQISGLESDLEDAQAEAVRLSERLAVCQAASASQVATIERLERSEQDNAERYLAETRRSDRLAEQITQMEQERQGQNRDEIRDAIESGTSDCGLEPMPDALRLRVTP